MRRILILFFVLVSLQVTAAKYYVSTTGSNSNPGTISQPFATPAYGFNQLSGGSGDTLYIRGGVYTYSMIGVTIFQNKDGQSTSNRLKVWNYPGEIPVFDFLDYGSTSSTQILRIENCDYVHIRGIEIRHNLQLPSGRLGYGFRVAQSVNYCFFELLNVHHCGGWGIIIWGGSNTNGQQSSNNIFYRIDSHHHSDRYSGTSGAWGGSDGFLINSYNGYAYPSLNNQFIECRAWWNSDDGWDNRLFNGSLTYSACQAFWNGWQPGETMSDPDIQAQGGNGYGFKLGSIYGAHTTNILRIMYNCIAFENRQIGIQCEWSDRSEGGYAFGSQIYNNTSYGNGTAGFSHGATVLGTTWLRNNLSYGNNYDIASDHTTINDDYNASTSSYWYRRDFIPSADDFSSLDSDGMDGPRQSDGSFPASTFLHLASTSDLIDAGIDVGLDYLNSAPDIGAYEYGDEDPDPPDPPTSINTHYRKKSGMYLMKRGKKIRF